MKHHKTAAVILALSMLLGAAATGCGGATPQEQEFPQAQPRKSVLITEKDYSEQEAQAFDILEDKLAADADRLLKSPYFIYNIYDDFSWKSEARTPSRRSWTSGTEASSRRSATRIRGAAAGVSGPLLLVRPVF